jgi:hypothetical protein
MAASSGKDNERKATMVQESTYVRDHLVNVRTRACKSICLACNLKRDDVVHKLATG